MVQFFACLRIAKIVFTQILAPKSSLRSSRSTDVITTCTLDYAEPTGQDVVDNSTDMEATYIFDELGLKSKAATLGAGLLLTHVVFHPVQKSANRLIQVVYTLRIRVG